MINFAGLGRGINAGMQGSNAMSDLISQAQGQKVMQQALQQIAQGNNSQQGAAQGPSPMPQATPSILNTQIASPPTGSQGPAAMPSGGVSPSGGSAAPTAGAPGGVGSTAPMGGAPAPQGSTGGNNFPDPNAAMRAYVQAVTGSQASPGAKMWALQNGLKLLQPQAQNTVRFETPQINAASREKVAGANIGGRMAVEKSRENAARELAAFKSTLSDKTNSDLAKELASTGNVYAKMAPDNPGYAEAKAKYDAVYTEITKRRGGKEPSAGKVAPQPASGAAPAEEERVTVSKEGQTFTVPKSQLQDALSQGYSQ